MIVAFAFKRNAIKGQWENLHKIHTQNFGKNVTREETIWKTYVPMVG
jgi:hypothetical protein